MDYTKQQKKIIKFISNYKPKVVNYIFKDIFQAILKEYYREVGIKIKNNSIFLIIKSEDKKNLNLYKNKIFELLCFLVELEKEKYLYFEKTEQYREEFSYSIYGETEEKLNFSEEKTKKILELLYSDIYVSGALRELTKSKFMSIEERNLRYTLFTIILGIVINAIGFYLQWHIATKVNTVIEFANFEDLKYIAELIKNLSK